MDTNKQELMVRPGLALRKITHAGEIDVLEHAAREDDHQLVFPTHGLWKKDASPGVAAYEPVGYVSLCVTPVVHLWMHTQKLKARDSFALIRKLEQMTIAQGHGMVVVPCWKESPMHPFMEKMGYAPFLQTTLFAKKLRPPEGGTPNRRRD